MKRFFEKSQKNGSVGNVHYKSINTRNLLVFIKINSNKVNVHFSSYNTINEKPTLILRRNYCELPHNLNHWDMQFIIREVFTSDIKLNWVRGQWIYTFSDGTKIVPYKGMKFSYDGESWGKHPKRYIKQTEDALEQARLRRNAMTRSRYHNNKAEERLDRSKVFYKRDVTTEEVQQGYDIEHRIDMTYALDSVPMTDVFKLWNVSQRRLLIDHYGMDNIISSLDHKVVDKQTIDGNPYELVIVKIPDGGSVDGFRNGTYLKMINPSTGEDHFEGVPNAVNKNMDRWQRRNSIKKNTVDCALAWRNNDNGKYIVPEKIT
tara:strand:- start:568 stop:1521 length:954 start_codon:yes stop_codon:yes gene_type:complete